MVVGARNRKWQELDKRDIGLDRLAQHYEAFNRSEGKSPRTVEWYSRVLAYFGNYLGERGLPSRLGDLNIFMVREFILYLQTKDKWKGHPCMPSAQGRLAPISIQTYVRGLRAFFGWLPREGYTEESVLANLKPPKAPQKLVEVLTEEEIRKILACLAPDAASWCRDTAMVITMLDTGLRLSETANLRMADAFLEQNYLIVMGKGSKQRIVPIGNRAQRTLQRYVFHFRPQPLDNENNHLFLTLKDRLTLDRLAHQMRCSKGEAQWDEACDLEALIYMYPATLAAPLS